MDGFIGWKYQQEITCKLSILTVSELAAKIKSVITICYDVSGFSYIWQFAAFTRKACGCLQGKVLLFQGSVSSIPCQGRFYARV